MSQADYALANAAGATFRADLNSTLLAIVGQNSGASEPTTMFAYQLWYDTTNDILKIRNAANTAWINLRDKVGRYQLDSGTADAMVITPEPAYTAYFTGMEFLVKKSASANTGAVTLKVNALAAVSIKDTNGQDPGASDLKANELALLAYNGTNFVLMNSPANIANLSRAIDIDATLHTVTSTFAETNLYSFSVPGGTLGTNGMLRFTQYGSVLNNSGGNLTKTWRAYYGTTVISFGVPDFPFSAIERSWAFEVLLSAKNVTSDQACLGKLRVGGLDGVSGGLGSLLVDTDSIHDTVAQDSTGALTFKTTIQHEDNLASEVTNARYAVLEAVGTP